VKKGYLLGLLVIFVCFVFETSNFLNASPLDISIDWTHYHNYTETTKILKSFAAEYKDLCKLSSIGKSFQGNEIWCLEMTNYRTGIPETKPGVNINGNTHAGEVSGAEVSLYLIDYLLRNYGKDPYVNKLMDTRVFYVIPKINPDGSDAYLKKPGEPVDSNLKKVDDDHDGLLDEDGVEDLNGDGVITLMRIRDDNGPMITSPEDPRLMIERRIDEKGQWRIIGPEGIDNDNDGKINEDPPGSIKSVSNRNYPAFWAPERIQSGAGIYPLSEPESKAQVDFLLAHPNIAATQAYHTHAGIILWGYAALPTDQMPPEDRRNYRSIGLLGTAITGYPFVSVFEDFTTDKFNPRHGDFTDWVYDQYGAYGMVIEIWRAPGEPGDIFFSGRDFKVALEWNDKELGGKAFINWSKFKHPQFGDIEIGGWDNNFFTQNPPGKLAEAEWKKVCLFDLKRAELLAHLIISETKVIPLGADLFKVVAVVENEGFLPTNVTQKAIENRIAKPVIVNIELENAELLGGEEKVEIGHLKGNAPDTRIAQRDNGTARKNQRTIEWVVRSGGDGASVKITAVSQKAGTASKKVPLG